jgi:replicative DNA helicase
VNVFPGWLRNYVEGVAESTQTPTDAPGMAVISVLSTALAKKFYVRLTGEWSESLNTYTILALPPGNRKSSTMKISFFKIRKMTILKKTLLNRLKKEESDN